MSYGCWTRDGKAYKKLLAIPADPHERTVYLLNARLDTIERKLDWLHSHAANIPARNATDYRPWPGDLPESKP